MSREQLNEMGAAGRTYVAEKFNRDALAARYLAILTDVAGRSTRR
jgi:hypothetical protein